MNVSESSMVAVLNQIHDLYSKLQKRSEDSSYARNFRRIFEEIEHLGLRYHNPQGEAYEITRTDCEASIVGDADSDLYISEVIKPIIYQQSENGHRIIQRGVVIVETK